MQLKQRCQYFAKHFTEHPFDTQVMLHHHTPFQFLVAVILSAQCTDKRVNTISPALFNAFPSAYDMATASFEQLFPYIKSISYPNSKTKYLLNMSEQLVEQHKGEVPQTVKELQTLQGVGRKTAHVVASFLYGEQVLAVDTHVFRVSGRIGLRKATAKTPLAVEEELTRHFPKVLLPSLSHWLILHGRYTCTAHKPKCVSCAVSSLCKHYEKL